ncbi:P-loop containing nucleoside triphosphate hydrolase protein [Irpex rosettiformis]|uniref:P-loop containing nucleoside triphosphate hydrolase protein n=1 Tax=Irpex rosettiformis TaxID=378272 RepID=A0ACB8TZN0_9APHY|nr:P-loop containing nucleoside triphosphate hydrolase protein [Irpex rosettiformis]
MANSYRVKIAARLRPPITNEINDEGVQVQLADNGVSYISVPNPRDVSQIFKFPFTSCYGHDSTQEEIFDNDVRPLIDIVYSGVTVTVFAYGVTSSGKTHTMQGTKTQPGIIPRAVEALFEKQSGLQRYRANFAVSYMEIYKDEVYDLLVDRDNAPKLPVRENEAGVVFVANLTALPVASYENFERIYARASKHRSVASTNLNRASSRSHAILTITVTISDPVENRTLSGKLNLVDLAGSENNKMTGNDPSRMAESSAINKSLSVLGQVVHALNQGASRIPYRNSKLTRLLQDALGGSSVGLLICNLAPGVKFRQDTLNTLNFAVRTKNIENKPVVNERDNRPPPKPHFAAVQQAPPKLAPAVLPNLAHNAPSSSRPSLAPLSRPSSSGSSRVPRPSIASYSGVNRLSQTMLPPPIPQSQLQKATLTLTDKEIDERIAKAVEAEVARRLEERERERTKEEAVRREEDARRMATGKAKEDSAAKAAHTPSGAATPNGQRQIEIDSELKKRLEELEQKLEDSSKEIQMVDALSPVSRKRTGRAYVALARSHSQKGNLELALDLYRKAETYVPDNIRLKERIIEIEYAVKHDTAFHPSPKRPKKTRSRKKKQSSRSDYSIAQSDTDSLTQAESTDGLNSKGKEKENFGLKLTNAVLLQVGSPPKRVAADMLEGAGTPRKHKKGKVSVDEDDSDDGDWEQWEPPAPTKKQEVL